LPAKLTSEIPPGTQDTIVVADGIDSQDGDGLLAVIQDEGTGKQIVVDSLERAIRSRTGRREIWYRHRRSDLAFGGSGFKARRRRFPRETVAAPGRSCTCSDDCAARAKEPTAMNPVQPGTHGLFSCFIVSYEWLMK
jgi:hypothetical protein